MEPGDIVKFIRQHDYIYVRELGQGACGRTVLLLDDTIGEYFACKKFVPYDEGERETLFENFVREAKILLRTTHSNIVRVFGYHMYPDDKTGYLVMEYVEGTPLADYVASNPDRINELFVQAVDAFAYLESVSILHRDIRRSNLFVTGDGVLKVIDFGFGKAVVTPADFDKSVSLALWCDQPSEYATGLHDFATEVYFVGRLFAELIDELGLRDFSNDAVLHDMCHVTRGNRIQRFSDVHARVHSRSFDEAGFTAEEQDIYRAFADDMSEHVTKIERQTTCETDPQKIEKLLDDAYRRFSLEETVPDSRVVIRCVINGNYYYRQTGFSVETVRAFLRLLQASSPEKKQVLTANLLTRLDATPRYEDAALLLGDDIPF